MKQTLIALLLLGALQTQAQLTISINVDQYVSCYNQHDAIINAYSNYANLYSINGQYQTNGHFTGLGAGTYTVTAHYGSQSASEVVTLANPAKLSMTVETTSLFVCGQPLGAINAEATGGTTVLQPLQYSVYDITNTLLPGNPNNGYRDGLIYSHFTIRAEDDNGCFIQKQYFPLRQGDIDEDGNVDNTDLIAVQMLINWYAYYWKADLNNDANVDAMDLCIMENLVANLSCD